MDRIRSHEILTADEVFDKYGERRKFASIVALNEQWKGRVVTCAVICSQVHNKLVAAFGGHKVVDHLAKGDVCRPDAACIRIVWDQAFEQSLRSP